MFNFFKKKESFLEVDFHSHLIPGIDDGVKSWDESIHLIKNYISLGYKKLITTPHIIHNYYPNTPVQIRDKVIQLNKILVDKGINMTIEAGAEYYVDEHFCEEIERNIPLLTFGSNYILLETAFINRPIILDEICFKLQSKGLRPILAHPERYTYLQQDYSLVDNLIEKGMLMQINANSLVSYYSKAAKNLAAYMIKEKKVDFIGSDVHNLKHMDSHKKAMKSRLFEKCRQLKLQNNSL